MTPTEPPVLDLVGSPGTTGRAVGLVALVGRGVRVVSHHRLAGLDAGPPVATLATSGVALAGLAAGPAPVAAWADGPDDVEAARARGVAVVVASDPDLVGPGGVAVPVDGVDTGELVALAPIVRARWRERLGLAEDLVVAVDGPLTDDARTALAVCAAAVVVGPALVTALALGAPVVTSGSEAERLGLRSGHEVEVVDPAGSRDRAARALALDPARAAERSRLARRFAVDHLDLAAPARRVRIALGLDPDRDPRVAATSVAALLDELGTSPTSSTRRRATVAVAALEHPPPPGGPPVSSSIIDPAAARRLGGSPEEPGPGRPTAADAEAVGDDDTVGARVRAGARRLAAPAVARVRRELARAAAGEAAGLHQEVADLRAQLDRVRAEHAAELAALHEELATRR